jgi:hypothetical protein
VAARAAGNRGCRRFFYIVLIKWIARLDVLPCGPKVGMHYGSIHAEAARTLQTPD